MTNAPFEGAEGDLLPTGAGLTEPSADDSLIAPDDVIETENPSFDDSILQFPTVDRGGDVNESDDVELVDEEDLVSYNVQYGDHVFTIDEPDSATVLRMLQFVTNVATRAEKFKAANFSQTLKNAEVARATTASQLAHAATLVQSGQLDDQSELVQQLSRAVNGDFGTMRAELISFVNVVSSNINDLITLSAITFFGGTPEKEQEGKTFFQELYKRDSKSIKFAPLITALWYRFELSQDLRDSLKNLQRVQGRLKKIGGTIRRLGR